MKSFKQYIEGIATMFDPREKEVIFKQMLRGANVNSIISSIKSLFRKRVTYKDIIKLEDEFMVKYGIEIPEDVIASTQQNRYTVYRTVVNLLKQGNSIENISRIVNLNAQQIHQIMEIAKRFLT